MVEEIDIKELKAVILESIEKKKEERAYTHPLLLYVNHIEAMIKAGARHREVASYFNSKLGLSGKSSYTNQRLLNARNYWKKINVIDYREVDSILIQFRNSQTNNNFNNEVNELKEFMKEIYNITKQQINNIEEVKSFYNKHKDKGYSLSQLANVFVNGGV